MKYLMSDFPPAFMEIDDQCALYPGFRIWFHDKVLAGIRQGDRAVFVALNDAQVTGLAIVKRTATERKLCTMWVRHYARGNGVATRLAEAAFEWLGPRTPLLTIPEERIAEFRGLLNQWDFSLTERRFGYYRPGRCVFVVNGRLRASLGDIPVAKRTGNTESVFRIQDEKLQRTAPCKADYGRMFECHEITNLSRCRFEPSAASAESD